MKKHRLGNEIVGFALLCWLAGAVPALAATTYHVAPGGNDGNSGLSSALAFATIAHAVDVAVDGDTVVVDDGTYNVTAEIAVTEGLTIQSVNGSASTIIDGGGAVRCLSLNHPDAVLDGVTLRNGYIDFGGPCGGGLSLVDGLVRNCRVTACQGYATGNGNPQGGGVWMSGGALENCQVDTNTTTNGSSQTSRLIRGAGIYMTGGTVTGCTITGNRAYRGYPQAHGGGVYMTGGLLIDSTISGNRTDGFGNAYGGGVEVAGGVMRQCYVAGNTAQSTGAYGNGQGGGVYLLSGGAVESCTVVGNQSYQLGGGLQMTGGAVLNSIVFHNSAGVSDDNMSVGGGAVAYSCAPELPETSGNINQDPGFVAAGTGYGYLGHVPGDYHLAVGSLCRDAGSNQVWMSGAQDFDGANRIDGPVVDMGIYEAPYDPTLTANFSAPVTEGVTSLNVTFTATAAGGNTTITAYDWDFDNDGNFDQTTAVPTVAHVYGVGYYDVRLRITNSSSETAIRTRTAYIKVAPVVAYVSTTGSDQIPYDTPAKASNDVQSAVDVVADGGSVIVDDGTYTLTADLDTSKTIDLTSVNGRDLTIIDGDGTYRCLRVRNAGTLVDGFTFRNGYVNASTADAKGAGVWMDDGTVQNCHIIDCDVVGIGNSQVDGGGVYMQNGLLADCTVSGHLITNSSNQAPATLDGAGVYAGGGVVTGCTIADNLATRGSNPQLRGGGVVVAGALVTHCQITGNNCDNRGIINGGGAFVASGTLRNCLVAGNLADSDGAFGDAYGGGISVAGGAVESCTVVGNESYHHAGGLYQSGGTVTGTIVHENAATVDFDDYLAAGGTVSNSAAPELTDGVDGNKTGPPDFEVSGTGTGLGLTLGDYHLAAGSICRDAAVDPGWMAAGVDLDGNPRVVNSVPDMGVYEAALALGLSITFTADVTSGNGSLAVEFTAYPSGGNTTITNYEWDFENDGTIDQSGAGLGTVNHVFGVGYYDVYLRVQNSSSETATELRLAYIQVLPNVNYVSNSGSNTPPYDTPAKATPTLADAVANVAPGGTVMVAAGTYFVDLEVTLDQGTKVIGAGAATTVLDGEADSRIFVINHADSVVDGLTITNARDNILAAEGGGIRLLDGTVRNCRIVDCKAAAPGNSRGYGGGINVSGGLVENCVINNNESFNSSNQNDKHNHGGGVYMTGGIVRNCDISGNKVYRAGNPSLHGGGVQILGGLLENCTITGNTLDGRSGAFGGGLRVDGGTVRNCLIAGNLADSDGTYGIAQGGGVYQTGGVVENCTVSGNQSLQQTGGYQLSGGTVTNTIIYGNQAVTGNDLTEAGGTITYSDAPELTGGTGNINGDPDFVNAVGGDYHLSGGSPAINTGVTAAWMATATDLDGEARIQGGGVDMGAFEEVGGPACEDLEGTYLTALCAALDAQQPTSPEQFAAIALAVAQQVVTDNFALPSCVAELVLLAGP